MLRQHRPWKVKKLTSTTIWCSIFILWGERKVGSASHGRWLCLNFMLLCSSYLDISLLLHQSLLEVVLQLPKLTSTGNKPGQMWQGCHSATAEKNSTALGIDSASTVAFQFYWSASVELFSRLRIEYTCHGIPCMAASLHLRVYLNRTSFIGKYITGCVHGIYQKINENTDNTILCGTMGL